jgi:cellulose synthase/poly-beta-1,6-N-acetylglucosamine synthase-like glycosyltransferase
MLVEHGWPGAVIYLTALVIIAKRALLLFRRVKGTGSFVSVMLPAIAGSLAAMFIADMFVPYMRFEVRIWFVCLLWTLWRFQKQQSEVPATVGASPLSDVDVNGRARISIAAHAAPKGRY